jgi:hypothetical protein
MKQMTLFGGVALLAMALSGHPVWLANLRRGAVFDFHQEKLCSDNEGGRESNRRNDHIRTRR